MKTYATASRKKQSIYDQIEAIVVDVMTLHKIGSVDTNSCERENSYKAMKVAVDCFKSKHVHWENLSKDNITVLKTSILGIIKNASTAKIKSTTKVHLTKE